MNDAQILRHIQDLVDEEHHLLQQESAGELTDPQHVRRRELEESLDQCWDLLRQRRAKRSAGQDPDDAHTRPIEVVEHYQQ